MLEDLRNPLIDAGRLESSGAEIKAALRGRVCDTGRASWLGAVRGRLELRSKWQELTTEWATG